MRHPWRGIFILPALRAALLLALGIALRWHVAIGTPSLFAGATALCLAALMLALLEKRIREMRLPRDMLIAMMLVALGMLRCATALESFPTDLLRWADRREKVLLRGVVVSDPRLASDRQRFLLDATALHDAADSFAVTGRVLCRYGVSAWVEGDTLLPLRAGDVVELRCRLRVPRPPRNPHGFDARTWVLGEGAVLQASVSKGADLRLLGSGQVPMWKRLVSDIRQGMRHAIASLYSPEQAAVINGLLLGDRSGIDEETLGEFRRAGIMHILAVSGLHAGIVLSLFFLPLERLRFPLRATLALAGLWTYAAVTGFAPPVTRAALMATLLLGGTLFQRGGSSVNALGAAGAVILLLDPLALFGLSFQLSFAAVLGILLFHERIVASLGALLPRRLRCKAADGLLSLFALTLAAQSLTVPLLAGGFGEISIAGLATNLVAVPLVFVVVSCGMVSLLASFMWTAGAASLAATAGGALDLVVLLSGALSSLPFAVMDVPAFHPGVWILYLACIVHLSATPGRMRQKLFLLSLLVVTVVVGGLFALPSTPERLRVTFFDVGQGDAALVEIPGQLPWLIDAGPGDEKMNSGTQVILPALRAAGIRRLGALVITHPDNDHAGGAPAVIEGVSVDSVYVACAWSDHGDAGRVRVAARSRDSGVRDIREGERFDLGDETRIYVLSPPRGDGCEPSNENSVILLLQHGRTRFLFTGDAGVDTERRLIVRYDSFLRADVLKVGHHGSAGSTSPGFAVKVKPKHAVISAGRNNRFNHPRQEILTRLRLVGATIHRTDIEVAIILESDGRRVRKLQWNR